MSKKKSKGELTVGRMLFKGAFIHNPVLTQAIGLCPIVAIAYSIKAAAALSLTLLVLLVINELLACLAVRHLPRWLRISCYLLLSTATVSLVIPLFDKINPDLSNSMGIYLPLLTVNSLVVIRCEKFAVTASQRRKTGKAALFCLFDAISSSLGYAAVIMIVAIIRQSIASPGVFGIAPDSAVAVSAMTMPFGGLIVLGFLAATHKLIVNKYFPDEPVDTFDFSTSLRSPVLVDPGIHATQGVSRILDEPLTEKDKIRAAYGLSDKDKIELEAPDENAPALPATEDTAAAPIQLIPVDEDEKLPAEDEPGYVAPDIGDPFTQFDFDPEASYKQQARDFNDDDVLIAIPVDEDEQQLSQASPCEDEEDDK